MQRFIILFSTIIYVQLANADIISGLVVGVTDGDTITVLDHTNTQHKVRLAGIDAPEKKQAFGNASKKSLSELVYNKQVDVDWHKRDRYGRIVGKVIVGELDANLEQVRLGMAWYYKKYKGELVFEDRLGYVLAQENAEAAKLGLWSDNQPIPPWDFRKSRKSN
jgi:endonuclease YncB( thermonuclease family)